MKDYRHLLFDLDNTLLDFDRAEKTAFCAAFSAYGLLPDEQTYALYHRINDDLWKRLERGEISRERLFVLRFTMLLEKLRIRDGGLSEELSRAYFRLLSHQSFTVEGAEEVCRALAAEYSLHIITNGTAPVQRERLRGSGLLPYCTGIFISDEIGAAKPSPLFFSAVMTEIGAALPAECCVIGDSWSSDIAGALAAGIDAVWICPQGNAVPERAGCVTVLCDIRELPEYLRRRRT
jgi:YjjG family noncanonical pyrimidine nucleotidase